MPTLKQKALSLLGIKRLDHPFVVAYQRFRHTLRQTDKKLAKEYFNDSTRPSLHIGSSNRILPGWLNTDIEAGDAVMYMDATKTFPFADESFDFVFAEHMIEHIPYPQALNMLKECYRVLRPNGYLRVVTPDLSTTLSLYSHELSDQAKEYIHWMTSSFLTPAMSSPTFVINAMFRLWGHQFIYDEETLKACFSSAGFELPRRFDLGNSESEQLRNLENVTRYPPGLLNFESLCIEAKKTMTTREARNA